MQRSFPFTLLIVTVAVLPVRGELGFESSWQIPGYDEVHGIVEQWIVAAELDGEAAQQARSLWPSVELRPLENSAMLDRAIETFSIGDPRVRQLEAECNAARNSLAPPAAAWLDAEDISPTLAAHVRLYYARWLAQHQFYDETIAVLEGLEPGDVIDPAGLLFYRAAAYQQLVEPEKSRVALVQLLEHETQLPHRYQQLAGLLVRDLSGLEDESLDHIARRMNDVRRRLEIGKAGKQVQVVEKGVVDSLDEIIKRIEEQQQQQQSSSAPGGQQSSDPMKDSQLPSMEAPMKVDRRDIGHQSGWGDLPPKEREQALQQIGREFPAHYRELIEQYFRDLADQSSSPPAN